MEECLVFLKPDAVLRRCIGAAILQEFLKNDDKFSIVAFKEIQVSEELAQEHYKEHKEKYFFPWLVKSIRSAPVLAMIVRGPIQQIRDFLGATFVQKAEANTIRGKYGIWGGVNSVHASDCAESGIRELELWNTMVQLEKDAEASEKIQSYINIWSQDLNKENTLKIRELCEKLAENKTTKEQIYSELANLLKLECPEIEDKTIEHFTTIIIENILI